jgi:hypothetical protein
VFSFSPDFLSVLCPLQVFGETPMADVEMIFPEKIVGIKPFQLVNLAVTVFTALMTGALVLWKVRGSWCLLTSNQTCTSPEPWCSGQCVAQPQVAEASSSLPASAVVCMLGL